MSLELGKRLRIFTNESTKKNNIPLYEWVLNEALNHELNGASVFRGLAGFGPHQHLHTSKILSISSDLPIIIEIVDSVKKIEKFLPIINTIDNLFATIEDVQMINYQKKE